MCRNGEGERANLEQKCDAKSAGSFLGWKKTRECKPDNTGEYNLDQAKKTCQALHNKIGAFY